MSSWKRKLTVGLAAGVIALVATELVARAVSSSSFDPDVALADASKIVETMNGDRWRPREPNASDATAPDATGEPAFKLHPYYGLDRAGSDDWLGRDVKHFRAAKSKRSIDIVLLGGSVSVRFGNDCLRDIVDAFAKDARWADWEVRVYVQGRAAFRQPQMLHVLEYLLAIGYEPDIVIELDGFNELALGLQNANRGVHPALPSILDWGPVATTAPLTAGAIEHAAAVQREQRAAEACLASAERFGLFHSAIASWFVRRRIQGCFNRYSTAAVAFEHIQTSPAARTYVVGPPFDADEEVVVETCARLWAESSRAMDAICDRLGIRYVHVLQPTMHDTGSKPLTPQEIELGKEPAETIPAIERGYPRLRERGAELAKDGIEFVDLSRAFADVEQTLYEDTCHFSAEGNRILLAALMPQLLSVPPSAPPPDPPERKQPAGGGKKKRAK